MDACAVHDDTAGIVVEEETAIRREGVSLASRSRRAAEATNSAIVGDAWYFPASIEGFIGNALASALTAWAWKRSNPSNSTARH